MKDCDIKVGDVLQVREWDDMAEEYAEYAEDEDDEVIRIPKASFTKNMRYMCGSVFTVRRIYSEFRSKYYLSEEAVEARTPYDGTTTAVSSPVHPWYISSEMLEPFRGETAEIDISEDDFASDLILYMKEGIA